MGRLLLRRRTSRRGSCGGRSGSSPRTPSRPIPGSIPATPPPTAASSPRRHGSSPAARARGPALVIFARRLHPVRPRTPPPGRVYWEHDYPGVPRPPDPERGQHADLLVAGGRGRSRALRRRRGRAEGIAGLRGGAPAWPPATRCGSSRPTSTPRAACSTTGAAASGRRAPCSPTWGWSCSGRPTATSAAPRPRRVGRRPAHQRRRTWPGSTTRLSRRPDCDDDFGATRQRRGLAGGTTTFLGEGSKDGTYYSLEPAHRAGALVDQRGLRRVIGRVHRHHRLRRPASSTGRRRSGTSAASEARHRAASATRPTPATSVTQNPTDHAFDAARGAVLWQANNAASFSRHHGGRRDDVQRACAGGEGRRGARRRRRGRLSPRSRLPQSNWSGIATVGDALVLGLGSTCVPGRRESRC